MNAATPGQPYALLLMTRQIGQKLYIYNYGKTYLYISTNATDRRTLYEYGSFKTFSTILFIFSLLFTFLVNASILYSVYFCLVFIYSLFFGVLYSVYFVHYSQFCKPIQTLINRYIFGSSTILDYENSNMYKVLEMYSSIRSALRTMQKNSVLRLCSKIYISHDLLIH